MGDGAVKRTSVLILGGTGMLGHVLFRRLSQNPGLLVHATARSLAGIEDYFPAESRPRIRTDVDANNFDEVIRALAAIQPDVVINCIGLIKQLPLASDPLSSITVNAQLPHRITMICRAAGARMIHISTDCVFDGKRGGYTEKDTPNADDLYGQTKMLGEVSYPHSVTLRTSIIGHELKTRLGLIEWFLSQRGTVRGFTKAIYSGFTTIEVARIISDFVLPNSSLSGIYNISSAPISKHDLLRLVAQRYNKDIVIEPYDGFVLDRSLDSTKFRTQTGYVPSSWEKLIEEMHSDYRAHIGSCYAVV
jgi:dTDP-4-dehydrorhamnose reductase